MDFLTKTTPLQSGSANEGQESGKPRLAHIPELDGVRGIAAVMVLCHHLLFTSVPNPENWNAFVLYASRISHAGGNGIDLFFVLSGFLITSLLLLDRGSPHYYRNFYWKRALRILPLYLVALTCLVVFSPGSWKYAVLSLFFVANFAQLFHIASAGPFWTLAIEEQFYLVWPRFTSRLSIAKLRNLAIALVLASPLLRLADAAFGHHNYLFTFFHCDGLALGAVLACDQLRRTSVVFEQTSKPIFAQLSLVFPVALIFTALPFAFASWFALESKPMLALEALQLSGISLLSYSLVTAMVHHTGSSLLAIFRGRVLSFLGLVSYCLYIANGYVVIGYDRIRGPMETGNMKQYAIRAVAVCATTLAICILSRYAIELPALSLRKRVLRQP